jgi:eukaryotic-like serine/threonine-protein kinase
MPTSSTGELLAGRYRLEHAVARGGAGVVWRATDTSLGRPVAVKLLRPELEDDTTTVTRLKREAAAAAALTHPNAVVVYDIGEHDGRVHLVMEWVDGVSLDALLAQGTLPADEVALIGHDVARALAAAHDRGLVHRDVKPSNILVTRTGVAKIADFGIATVLGGAQSRLTDTGAVVGTAGYLAPEQLSDAPIDPRTDVYALGLVLNRAVTGNEPFGTGTAFEIAQRRLTLEPPPPSDVVPGMSPALDQVIVQATRRDPNQRFATAADLTRALAPLASEAVRPALARRVTEVGGLPDVTREIPLAAADTTVVSPRPPEPDVDATAVLPAVEPVRPAPPPPVVPPPAPAPAPAPAGELETATDHSTRSWLAALVIVVVGAIGAAALFTSLRGGGDGGGGDPGGGAGGGGSQAIAIAGAGDLDPHGDGSEHPEDVPKAFDGDPETYWTTERYNQVDLAPKPGVGIWFDLGQSVAVREVTLTLATNDVTLHVFVSDEPFEGRDPTDAQLVAEQAGAGGTVTLDAGGASGRYWAVWVTRVGEGRARLAEIAFAAA